MALLQVLTRKTFSLARILRHEGVGGVARAVQHRTALHWEVFSARKTRSLTFDGCSFPVARIPASPMKLAMLRGAYEEFERNAVRRHVRPDLPVIELGGCIGVVACITNRLLQDPERHVVVEPNPVVLPHLEESRRLNQCRFRIVHGAIAYDQPAVVFSPNRELWANSMTTRPREETVTVPTVRLGDLVSRYQFDRFTLICDIEGYEYELVLHETEVLRKATTLILETHPGVIGEAKTQQMLGVLRELGFHTVEEEAFVIVMKQRSEGSGAGPDGLDQPALRAG